MIWYHIRCYIIRWSIWYLFHFCFITKIQISKNIFIKKANNDLDIYGTFRYLPISKEKKKLTNIIEILDFSILANLDKYIVSKENKFQIVKDIPCYEYTVLKAFMFL